MSVCGFLLLSGGSSGRMGSPKALLEIRGQTLLGHMAKLGAHLPERILSVNSPDIPTPDGFLRLADFFPGCGPLSGLHAGLSVCESELLVVLPCDAPGCTPALVDFLASTISADEDALVLRDETGFIHPLPGVYRKTCLPVFAACLAEGRYGLMRALSSLHTRAVEPPPSLGSHIFLNLNTPEEYEAFCGADWLSP